MAWVIQEVYWKDLSWFKQLLLQIIIPLALMVPFVFFSNYDLVSNAISVVIRVCGSEWVLIIPYSCYFDAVLYVFIRG